MTVWLLHDEFSSDVIKESWEKGKGMKNPETCNRCDMYQYVHLSDSTFYAHYFFFSGCTTWNNSKHSKVKNYNILEIDIITLPSCKQTIDPCGCDICGQN